MRKGQLSTVNPRRDNEKYESEVGTSHGINLFAYLSVCLTIISRYVAEDNDVYELSKATHTTYAPVASQIFYSVHHKVTYTKLFLTLRTIYSGFE